MATSVVRAKRTRACSNGWRSRDVAIATGAIALVVMAGVTIYVRERRLQGQRRQERVRALREIDAAATRSMTATERDAYYETAAEVNREYEAQGR